MYHNSLFVFDIETIPDTEAVPNLTGFDDPDVQARRDEIERYHLDITDGRNSFPRQPFHKVAAVSFLEAEIERNGKHEFYHLRELRSGGNEDASEQEIVEGFFRYLERLRARLVTYNGRTFDVPVMKYRAMKYGIQAEWLHQSGDKWNSYTSRYSSDWHCDLIEILSDYGASARVKLNEVCSILGYPGKFGVDGSKVSEMFDNGEIAAIRHYCETDVLNTYLVYLRTQHHTGVLTTEGYNKAIADIITFIDNQKDERPYFQEFMEAWEEACDGKYLLGE